MVGGSSADVSQLPFVAAIGLRDGGSSFRQFCGGSVVSSGAVLTAAHCVRGREAADLEVMVGSTDLDQANGGERIGVSAIVLHPLARDRSFVNDAALLQLAAPTSQPAVKLAPPVAARSRAGPSALIAGWGATSEGSASAGTLRAAEVSVLPDSRCARAYGWGYARASMLCAGRPEGGVDSCQGDSGGPLLLDQGGWKLAGIVSWGEGCARPGRPGVYTRLGAPVLGRWVGAASALLAQGPPAAGSPRTTAHRIGGVARRFRPAFKLSSPGSPWAAFRCRFDRGPLLPCGSRARARSRLAPGRHRLAVSAIGIFGAVDPSPARLRFSIPRP